MAEEQLREVASNCCNGRVGRELMELATSNAAIRNMIAPTGVELVQKAEAAGIAARGTTNCCNGRVGRSLLEDAVAAMGGT
jgi:hypothetical protein